MINDPLSVRKTLNQSAPFLPGIPISPSSWTRAPRAWRVQGGSGYAILGPALRGLGVWG